MIPPKKRVDPELVSGSEMFQDLNCRPEYLPAIRAEPTKMKEAVPIVVDASFYLQIKLLKDLMIIR